MKLSTSPKLRKILIAVVILFVLNLGLAVYLTVEFYAPSGNSFCAINEVFDCVSVSQTEYAKLFGVSVALWGSLFYLGLLVGALGLLFKWPFERIAKWLKPHVVYKLVTYFTYFGVLFSLYLTYAEAFLIGKYCPLCLAQQAFILAAAILLLVGSYEIKKRNFVEKLLKI